MKKYNQVPIVDHRLMINRKKKMVWFHNFLFWFVLSIFVFQIFGFLFYLHDYQFIEKITKLYWKIIQQALVSIKNHFIHSSKYLTLRYYFFIFSERWKIKMPKFVTLQHFCFNDEVNFFIIFSKLSKVSGYVKFRQITEFSSLILSNWWIYKFIQNIKL